MTEKDKTVELNDEDLKNVSGGGSTNTKDQGLKYQVGTKVKYYSNFGNELQIFGIVTGGVWNVKYNQYQYHISHDRISYWDNGKFGYLEAEVEDILEEKIIYDC